MGREDPLEHFIDIIILIVFAVFFIPLAVIYIIYRWWKSLRNESR